MTPAERLMFVLLERQRAVDAIVDELGITIGDTLRHQLQRILDAQDLMMEKAMTAAYETFERVRMLATALARERAEHAAALTAPPAPAADTPEPKAR